MYYNQINSILTYVKVKAIFPSIDIYDGWFQIKIMILVNIVIWIKF